VFNFKKMRPLLAVAALGAAALFPVAALATGGGYEDGGHDYEQGKDEGKGGYYGHKGGGQDTEQSVKGGDQTVDQSNTAEVVQKQGNGNFNLAPALSKGVFGGFDSGSQCGKCDYGGKGKSGHQEEPSATTRNSQGNDNDAHAKVLQGNWADQSQRSNQDQSVMPGSSSPWSKGGEQDADQSAKGGDQDVHQGNDASVAQKQGNHNFNLGPALALGSGALSDPGCGCEGKDRGDGKSKNFGGHDDGANTSNYQGNGNDADAWVLQGNHADQSQRANQDQSVMSGATGLFGKSGEQDAEQKAEGGDQTAHQSNTADVTQKQGNGNVNVSPALSVFGGDAETTNYQGNHNDADATVAQGNDADQSQGANQDQTVMSGVTGMFGRAGEQDAEQKVEGGDQSATQSNDGSVEQKQGNGNINVSPAISIFGGDAESKNYQGNGNDADATVAQGNSADQSQTARQTSILSPLLGGN
jgi:hypothetical protein